MIEFTELPAVAPDTSLPASAVLPNDHNGGPPLEDPEEHVPEWGAGGIGNYFDWRRARREAWKPVPRETMLRRLKKARACGLTYEEYTLALLETGRYVQPGDTELIARFRAKRGDIPVAG